MSTADAGLVPTLILGCKIDQLATYPDNSGIVDVDPEIWAALDSQNRAALFGHEAFYRMNRDNGDVTSHNVRRVVAYLFSTTLPARQIEGVPSTAMTCNSWKWVMDQHTYRCASPDLMTGVSFRGAANVEHPSSFCETPLIRISASQQLLNAWKTRQLS